MQTIHEVPSKFRVMLVRDYSPHLGSKRVITRSTPFVMIYRAPDAEKAENQELTDEVFKMFLTLEKDQAKTVNKYIDEQFRMSDGMLEELLNSPKELLEHVK